MKVLNRDKRRANIFKIWLLWFRKWNFLEFNSSSESHNKGGYSPKFVLTCNGNCYESVTYLPNLKKTDYFLKLKIHMRLWMSLK
jgi:hypothetical protein